MVTGVVLLLTAPSLPAGCSTEMHQCVRNPGETDPDFAARESEAGRSDAQPKSGWIAGGIGLGIVGAGLLWHFLEPSAKTTTATAGSLKMTPWASSGLLGGAVGLTF
jgi:hypothetical protein